MSENVIYIDFGINTNASQKCSAHNSLMVDDVELALAKTNHN